MPTGRVYMLAAFATPVSIFLFYSMFADLVGGVWRAGRAVLGGAGAVFSGAAEQRAMRQRDRLIASLAWTGVLDQAEFEALCAGWLRLHGWTTQFMVGSAAGFLANPDTPTPLLAERAGRVVLLRCCLGPGSIDAAGLDRLAETAAGREVLLCFLQAPTSALVQQALQRDMLAMHYPGLTALR